MAWENPVTTWGQAGKTVPGAGDFNRIEGNILHLQDTKETPAGAQAKAEAAAGAVQDELNTHKADGATTSQKGHVQLIDSVSSTSTTTAATPKNVKQAYDLANLALPKAGGTMTGEINMADKLLTRPEIKDYAETVGTTPATTGSVTFNLTTGNIFNLTPTGNVTIGFSNPPASGRAGSATIILTNGATVYSKTFNASIKWVNDFVPDTSEANKVYILVFMTTNGGTTWRGSCIGAYTA